LASVVGVLIDPTAVEMLAVATVVGHHVIEMSAFPALLAARVHGKAVVWDVNLDEGLFALATMDVAQLQGHFQVRNHVANRDPTVIPAHEHDVSGAKTPEKLVLVLRLRAAGRGTRFRCPDQASTAQQETEPDCPWAEEN
jgi:hypothetical protein